MINRSHPATTSAGYARQAALLRASIYTGVLETWVRLGLIGVGAVILAFAMPPAVPLVWFGLYAATFLYHNRYINALPDAPTQGQYRCGLMLLYSASLLYALFAVYLIQHDHPLLVFAGITAFMGHVIVTLSRDMTHRDTALFDGILIPILAIIIWLTTTSELPVTQRLIAGCVTVSGVAYYVHALWRRYREQWSFADNQARMFHSQRHEGLGRLTGGIAHDFNNILTALMGNLELAREIDDPKERDALTLEAMSAARRAADLTAQLLAFSGRAPYRAEVVDLVQTLPALTRLADRITGDACTISVTLPEDGPRLVRTDPSQLQNALIAVMLNACEAMEDGGVVQLTVEPLMIDSPRPGAGGSELAPGSYQEIIVTDEGKGIPSESLPKITEPFFTTKQVGDGPGLGLSMARGFAEQSGGTLTVDSTPGSGTEVRLALPVAQAA